jgi:hypothetical protein
VVQIARQPQAVLREEGLCELVPQTQGSRPFCVDVLSRIHAEVTDRKVAQPAVPGGVHVLWTNAFSRDGEEGVLT